MIFYTLIKLVFQIKFYNLETLLRGSSPVFSNIKVLKPSQVINLGGKIEFILNLGSRSRYYQRQLQNTAFQ